MLAGSAPAPVAAWIRRRHTVAMRALAFVVLPLLLGGTALVAQVDLERAATELAHVLDRPSGTTIGAAQKAALAEFLQRYEGEDLGALGYASAMASYLDRDMPGAVASLDAFFARHPTIANEEHRLVAGRIYLSSLAAAGRAETIDVASLHRHAESAARMYADLRTLARVATPLLANERVVDKAALRVALLRGACAGGADAATIDAFAAGLYGEVAPPAPPARRAPAPTVDLVGKPAPSWTATDVVRVGGDKTGLSSGDLLGKVVVLDFFASWCPPCRAAIPHLVELQAKHRADLQVVALTKAYGYGMDFGDPEAKVPSGGQNVRGLDYANEVALYAPLAKAFGIDYPIAFVDPEVSASYGVRVIPTLVVLDRAGKVVGVQEGADLDGLRALVQRALGGR